MVDFQHLICLIPKLKGKEYKNKLKFQYEILGEDEKHQSEKWSVELEYLTQGIKLNLYYDIDFCFSPENAICK
eukprot:5640195-Ditylum_brightwellii.AAC.1